MGGRGSSSARGGGLGGAGGAFTVTQNANGGVTIVPNAQNQQTQFAGGGSGVSDVNTHTTYFTPADYATVTRANTDGYAFAQRSGDWVPVGYFQTGYYSNVNSELRDLANGRRRSLTPQTQNVVDAMDRNMRPLNAPMDTVRWTDTRALADNIGLSTSASKSQIINRLSQGDVVSIKSDYTSSSWNPKDNAVAGNAGRYVKMDYHYAQGAKVAFSPTRLEGEAVGARDTAQRYSNARMQRMLVQNTKGRNQYADVLVVDVYVDQ